MLVGFEFPIFFKHDFDSSADKRGVTQIKAAAPLQHHYQEIESGPVSFSRCRDDLFSQHDLPSTAPGSGWNPWILKSQHALRDRWTSTARDLRPWPAAAAMPKCLASSTVCVCVWLCPAAHHQQHQAPGRQVQYLLRQAAASAAVNVTLSHCPSIQKPAVRLHG